MGVRWVAVVNGRHNGILINTLATHDYHICSYVICWVTAQMHQILFD